MGYDRVMILPGLLSMGGFLDFPANEVCGSPKPIGFHRLWVTTGMG